MKLLNYWSRQIARRWIILSRINPKKIKIIKYNKIRIKNHNKIKIKNHNKIRIKKVWKNTKSEKISKSS